LENEKEKPDNQIKELKLEESGRINEEINVINDIKNSIMNFILRDLRDIMVLPMEELRIQKFKQILN